MADKIDLEPIGADEGCGYDSGAVVVIGVADARGEIAEFSNLAADGLIGFGGVRGEVVFADEGNGQTSGELVVVMTLLGCLF